MKFKYNQISVTQPYSELEFTCLKQAEKEKCFKIMLKYTTYTNIYYNINRFKFYNLSEKWKKIATRKQRSLFIQKNKPRKGHWILKKITMGSDKIQMVFYFYL